MTVGELQAEIGKWQRESFPGTPPSVGGCVLAEEVGELLHCVAKRECGIRADSTTDAHVIDAFGDSFIALAGLADRMGFNLADAIAVTWRKVKRRKWSERAMRPQGEEPQ